MIKKTENILMAYLKDEKGATAIEYGFIALFIAVACIVAIISIGNSVNNSFSNVAAGFK